MSQSNLVEIEYTENVTEDKIIQRTTTKRKMIVKLRPSKPSKHLLYHT